MSGKRTAQERFPEVIAAAVRVFTHEGYRAARMSDVAREAGLSEVALPVAIMSGIFDPTFSVPGCWRLCARRVAVPVAVTSATPPGALRLRRAGPQTGRAIVTLRASGLSRVAGPLRAGYHQYLE